ncbi:MAG: sensor histidine kinase [Acidobacteria bacterium]|nr:sensor histidine kinase [Acidobacteriota bacterium]
MLEQHLVILLLKLAVAASLASILGRSGAFLRMLLREERTYQQRFQMAIGFGVIFGGSIALRVLSNNNFQALDLGLEGALLAGILGGYFTGLTGGVLISLAACANGEWLAMILYAGVGVLGGLLRDVAPATDDIWSFSPYFDLNVYRLFRAKYDTRITAFHLFQFLTIVFAEFLRWALDQISPDRLLHTLYANWDQPGWLDMVMIYTTTLFAFAIPLKIWNSIRQEKTLEAQQLLLTEARLRALTSQINPHFLFNTLNTVNSLIRTDPEQARAVVRKLSNILRRLLRKDDNLSPLRDELSFINDYLSIEMTRFGEKLRFVNEASADTLDRLIPSMLLQPIIENSIKHGLSSKVEGGTITLRTRIFNERVHIEIEDDGVGVPEEKLGTMFDSGIGVSNVNERLKVLFQGDYRMDIDTRPGEGTRTHIEFPDLNTRH